MIDLDFITKLNTFLAAHPASSTRWFSTAKRNKSVGGAPESAHLLKYNNAIDLVFDSDLELIDAAANAHHFGFTGIELDLSNKHLHLDTKPRFWQVVHHSKDNEEPLDVWLKHTYPNLNTNTSTRI